MNIQLSKEEVDLLAQVTKACHAGIDKAIESPSEAAEGLQAALATLTLVQNETEKGKAGLKHVMDNREQMTREALESVLRHASDPEAATAALNRVAACAPPVAAAPEKAHPAPAAVSALPTFGEVSQKYIEMGKGRSRRDREN